MLWKQLGKVMVHVVTAAQDAEKAAEEAKAASTKAELHNLAVKKDVLDIAQKVRHLIEEGGSKTWPGARV